MNIIVTENYAKSCEIAAEEIINLVLENPKAKLGLATGGTAQNVYPCLVDAYERKRVSFANVSTVNLDEYIGMSPDNPLSYRKCMDDWFFDKVDIDKKNTYVPSGENDIQDEIAIFNKKLYNDKMLDFQLLGVGVSGHIGFNEPNAFLTSGVHVENLDQSTIDSNSRFFKSKDEVPNTSITMGIGDIMKAKKIVLIATGENKANVMKELLLNDEIKTQVPVTMLKMHRNCTIILDSALAQNCGYIKK